MYTIFSYTKPDYTNLNIFFFLLNFFFYTQNDKNQYVQFDLKKERKNVAKTTRRNNKNTNIILL